MSQKTFLTGNRPVAIGIDLGGTGIKYGACFSDGEILFSKSRQSPVKEGADAIIDAMIDSGHELIGLASKHKLKVSAIGIGSPGGIDVVRGIVLGNTPNIPNWKGVKIKERISNALGIPCAVDNDANLFMLAESLYGAARGYRNAIGLTIGTGIGGGILIDGKIYHGSGFIGAEIGHIPIVAKKRQCKCGLKGCLEAYASAPALVRIYKSMKKNSPSDINAKTIFKLAKSHDPLAEKAVDEWCDYLACGIASAANLLNPEVVILGGGVAEAGSYLKNKVELAIQDKIIPQTLSGLKIKIAELGNKAGWLGAAAHALISIGKMKIA